MKSTLPKAGSLENIFRLADKQQDSLEIGDEE